MSGNTPKHSLVVKERTAENSGCGAENIKPLCHLAQLGVANPSLSSECPGLVSISGTMAATNLLASLALPSNKHVGQNTVALMVSLSVFLPPGITSP